MNKFSKKVYICLFEPRKMGLYLGEKISRSILHLLLLCMIVISPLALKLISQEEITIASREHIEDVLVENIDSYDAHIKNGQLSGSKGLSFAIEEGLVFINPNDEDLKLDNVEDVSSYIIEFNRQGVTVVFMNSVIHFNNYSDFGDIEIDFSKIADADYEELGKFLKVLNLTFESYRDGWVLTNMLFAYFELFITVIFHAFIMSLLVKMVNPLIKQRFRFKGALDAQFIFLVFMLFAVLFKASYLRYVGMFFACMYLFRAMSVIVRIEVKRALQNKKSGDE